MVPMMMPNAATAAVSMRFGLGGPCETVTTACAAGTHAIGNAARLVASGRTTVAVAGGAEAVIVEIAVAGFRNMTALCNNEFSRPFDVERDGFVMGEGAGILILEEWEHAIARGATIFAEVLGAASTADAHHITAPDPSRSWRRSLHGTRARRRATHRPPKCRTSTRTAPRPRSTTSPKPVAVRQVFGDDAPPVTSIKGHLGHSLGCGGRPRRCRLRDHAAATSSFPRRPARPSSIPRSRWTSSLASRDQPTST